MSVAWKLVKLRTMFFHFDAIAIHLTQKSNLLYKALRVFIPLNIFALDCYVPSVIHLGVRLSLMQTNSQIRFVKIGGNYGEVAALVFNHSTAGESA